MTPNILLVLIHQGQTIDLHVPADIRVSQLLAILTDKLHLRPERSFIRCENPVAMLAGDMTLADYGLHDGSTLYL